MRKRIVERVKEIALEEGFDVALCILAEGGIEACVWSIDKSLKKVA